MCCTIHLISPYLQVSKTLLVDLPDCAAFTVEDFVKMQEKHIAKQSTALQGKNLEIEFAVRDLLKTISSYKLEVHVEEVNEEDMAKLKKVLTGLCVRADISES
jgi:hypothetical protein